MPLLPSRRKFSCSGSGSTGRHHAHRACRASGRRRLSFSECGRARACAVFWQHTVLMPGAFLLGLRRHGILRVCLTEPCARPDPSRLPRVVIDIVRSTKMILASFPPVRQSSLSIFKSTVCASRTVLSRSIRRRLLLRGSRRKGGRVHLTQSLGSWLSGDGRSCLAGEYVRRVKALRRLMWRRRAVHRWAAHGSMCRWGRTGSIRVSRSLTDGRSQVSGEVEDELAVDDHVIVRLLKIARKHLCGGLVYLSWVTS